MQMNFEQFCFADEQSNWNKPSPSHESTLMESNDMRMRSSGQNSDSQGEESHSKLPPTIKLIRKKYEPIRDGDRIIKYEDNPSEYRKARKKIQNRLSATRVRGKKKTHLEEIEGEVYSLRDKNSELLLINAKLQAQNNMLRERVVFLQKVVLNRNQSEADSYISTTPSSASPLSNGGSQVEYKSPFEDLDDGGSLWSRVSSPKRMSKEWMTLTIFTIMLAVVVIPSSKGPETAMIAAKINEVESKDKEWLGMLNAMYYNTVELETIKWYIKAGLIAAYICFVVFLAISKIDALRLKKMKRF